MPQSIFVNLPVSDLARSMAFYEAIGFRNEPMFTDDTAACMVLSDAIFLMLLTHGKFKEFTPKEIVDARTSSEVLIALSRDSREAVDTIHREAIAAGGREARPVEDLGFMYTHAFEDPDGHIYEPFYMDMEAAKEAHDKAPAEA
ncbi:MAG: VOC family protein [Sphingosinicella sp.]